ncbi:MAG: hypothetical protein M1827_000076 [Pycnora praestabilis]|nr:MAG: hypothetical protein M1827_000076 [Pycnora praestabilis]
MAILGPSLSGLPNEVIQNILYHLPPHSSSTLQRVSNRFLDITNEPLLWRYYCRTEFKYWNAHHNIREKLAGNVSVVDWKELYIHRANVEHATTSTLNSILAGQTGRIDKFQKIVDLGYDAKDALLRHYHVGDDTEDVLARSDAVLGCLHRTLAIQEWCKLKDGEPTSLERALAAYDMFVLHDRTGDFEEVSDYMHDLALRVKIECPNFEDLTVRERALSLARFLRENNLTGLSSEDTYKDLQNSFIGIALQDKDHPSLPLVSVAIFCSLAQRLGLDARPCGFPFHVHAIVHAPQGETLDGRVLPPGHCDLRESMYLDPFRSHRETPVESLRAQLDSIGVSPSSYLTYLVDSPTEDIVLRTGRNIMSSVQESHQNAMVHNTNNRTHYLSTANTFPDMESAFYGALWAALILGVSTDGEGPVAFLVRRRQYLPYIVEHFETHFPTDVSLVEEYILPLFRNLQEHDQLCNTVRVMRAGDTMPKRVVRRDHEEAARQIKYKVGQVFKHKRYNYQAVITGWDVECGAAEQWMRQMRVDELSGGRHQSFYHVLVEDKSVRYVAEENIEIEVLEVPRNLMNLAGRYFKRWSNDHFVSNIKDEYPDD